jgi:hypothetical protein
VFKLSITQTNPAALPLSANNAIDLINIVSRTKGSNSWKSAGLEQAISAAIAEAVCLGT